MTFTRRTFNTPGGVLAFLCSIIFSAPTRANAVYTYVGTAFTSTSGCLSNATHLTMKLVFSTPLINGCQNPEPISWTVTDGVSKHHGTRAEVVGFALCGFNGSIDNNQGWIFIIQTMTKKGVPIYVAGTENTVGGNTVIQSDGVSNYKCTPEGGASNSNSPGVWSGP